MENKFVTVDGFQVGYYVSGGKATWYSKLEKYGSDATIFIDSGETLLNSFTEAKNVNGRKNIIWRIYPRT